MPYVLQCRVLEPFRPGQLTLVPALGEIITKESFDDAAHKKKTSKTMHESMFSRAIVSVTTGRDRIMKSASGVVENTFVVRSPLLEAANRNREVCMNRLNPFWSVLRCLGPHSVPNMEIVMESVLVPQLDLGGSRVTSKGRNALEFAVEVPVLRNVVAIDTGGILCLPWRFEDTSEGDEQ